MKALCCGICGRAEWYWRRYSAKPSDGGWTRQYLALVDGEIKCEGCIVNGYDKATYWPKKDDWERKDAPKR